MYSGCILVNTLSSSEGAKAIACIPACMRFSSMTSKPIVSIATGSVAKYRVLCSQRYFRTLLPGPPWYAPMMPSMILRTTFCRMTGMSTTVGINMPQALFDLLTWLRYTLFANPWERFFNAIVTPADWWCFSTPRFTSLFASFVRSFET